MFTDRTSPPLTDAVQASFDSATTTVGVATGLVATGRAIDLAGLDGMAGRLCAQILDLPPELGVRFRPALLELDGRLAALHATIIARLAQ
jgi:hypothetical protein